MANVYNEKISASRKMFALCKIIFLTGAKSLVTIALMKKQHPLAKWASERGDQRKLAKLAGCSESHISLILQGKRTPSLSMANKLSQATGKAVSINDMVLK